RSEDEALARSVLEKEAAGLRKQAEDERTARLLVERRLDPNFNLGFKFLTMMKGVPPAKAEIWFGGPPESFILALVIHNLLGEKPPGGLVWTVSDLMPIPAGQDPNLGDIGLVVSSELPFVCEPSPPNPCAGLRQALGVSIPNSGPIISQSKKLPKDTFLIV